MYPLRHIQDFAYNLSGFKIFSKLDLVKAYNQIPVNPDDVPKTAICTPFGLFEFIFMPFGLRNAAQTCQRLLDEITQGLDFCFPYLDDILIASKNEEEHKAHLRTLFKRLSDHGILLNIAKCELGVAEIDFLGYKITAEGTKPRNERVDAISKFPRPETCGQLRSFLGMLNFYHRFLKTAAQDQAPLHAMLADKTKKHKNEPLNWSAETEAAFQLCKDTLAQCTLLAHPFDDKPPAVVTDASDFAMGAALQQLVSEIEAVEQHPLDFTALAKSQEEDEELKALLKKGSSLSFNLPTQRFAVIHVDLVVLPPSKGYRYMLTIVDRFSRWMECIPLENMTAETVVRTIYNEWIPRYGCPQTIVTDQSRQFESEIFKIFASSFGIHLNRTTAYHPQCNGLVERLHRTLKTALMCHDADSWTEVLPMVLLGLRTQFKEVLQASAAEVLYGEPLRIPGERRLVSSGHVVKKLPENSTFVRVLD
ncbi:Hypothetical predicted protein [Cloeon dipterum]|uniref:RNA-directed DNA polymerase n=1 Tax=Cloeon dipterum TaxID=197152 RepID=A0A8S1DLV0_9INSE|nr:Hypothetical predicted protein [Cloeon dipterum]